MSYNSRSPIIPKGLKIRAESTQRALKLQGMDIAKV